MSPKIISCLKNKKKSLAIKIGVSSYRGHMQNSWAVPAGNTLTPLFEAYTEITALAKFVEMNGEGFRKIVKKFDKTMGTHFLNRQEAGVREGGRGK